MSVSEYITQRVTCQEHGCLPVEQWKTKVGTGMEQVCYQCANCGAAWMVQRIECTSCGEGPVEAGKEVNS